jgi:hypothetical protein
MFLISDDTERGEVKMFGSNEESNLIKGIISALLLEGLGIIVIIGIANILSLL